MAPEHDDGSAAVAVEPSRSEERAKELLRTASHDLRSPLTAIQLLVQRAERRLQVGGESSAPELTGTLSRIARSAQHALALIEDLLCTERLSPSNRAIAPSDSEVDVEDVIAEAIIVQKEALDEAGCAVTVTRKPGLDRARGYWNRGCLLRVFSNLLQNVSKYAPLAPVHVQLARAGDRLRIVFADRGPGLSIRGTTGKYMDDGLAPTGPHGLGLWIVRRGVAELNGSLKIRNAPGVGLAFAIELPGLLC